MNFFKKLFSQAEASKEVPTELTMQDFAASLISPSALMSHEKISDALTKKYSNLSNEEIQGLLDKSLEIFKECEKIPYSDADFTERVMNLYPFLSKKTISSIHGAVHFSQIH